MTKGFFFFFAIGLLFVGAGCARAPAPEQKDQSTSEEDQATEDTSSSNSQNETGRSRGRGSVKDVAGAGPRHVLLVDSACEMAVYTTNAENVIREKDLGTYTVVFAQFGEAEPPKVSESDACLKMSFPVRDVKSLKEMLTILQADLQKDLEEKDVSVSLQNDLPGSCDEVASQIAKRFPDFAKKAQARCEELKKQQQQDEQEGGNEELQYDSTNQQCGTKPDTACSPSMSATEYVKYTMSFVTPTNQTVITESGLYEDIGSMYVAMQKRPWQSDPTVFGCSDKFQQPSYYFTTAPTLESSMMCGTSVGDCDDKANAFASEIIASGLFADDEVRVALGTVQFGSKPSDIGGHAWTEVYLSDEKIWIPVDAVMGNTCYDNGKCVIYDEDDFIEWDHFKFVEYPVIEYWGWANHKLFYIPSTKQGSSNLPDYWKEESKTVYEAK